MYPRDRLILATPADVVKIKRLDLLSFCWDYLFTSPVFVFPPAVVSIPRILFARPRSRRIFESQGADIALMLRFRASGYPSRSLSFSIFVSSAVLNFQGSMPYSTATPNRFHLTFPSRGHNCGLVFSSVGSCVQWPVHAFLLPSGRLQKEDFQ